MPITLKSTGGGSVSIDVPSTGSTFTLTAPANNATIFTTDGGAITGNVAFTSNNISIGGQTISPFGGMKNRIINGDMRIDQRYGGASVTGNNAVFGPDRWKVGATQSSKLTMQQSTTSPTGFKNSLLITSSSAYSVGASDEFEMIQWIEGYNVSDLGWGAAGALSITLSFWVRSSLTGTFGGVIYNGASNRSYIFSYTINSANTWEKETITIPGDTAGTWLTDNGQGLGVLFCIGAGSSLLSTAGSWSSTFYRGPTGQTSIVGTSGATFYITGVQLEVGTAATPFEFRPFGHELALCQRYCYVKNTSNDWIGSGVWYSPSAVVVGFPHPVPMRATPSIFGSFTMTCYSSSAAFSSNQPTLNTAGPLGMELYATMASGSTTAGFGTSCRMLTGPMIVSVEL